LVLPRKSFFLLIAFNRKWKQVYKLVWKKFKNSFLQCFRKK
jgi:hypothetical protein